MSNWFPLVMVLDEITAVAGCDDDVVVLDARGTIPYRKYLTRIMSTKCPGCSMERGCWNQHDCSMGCWNQHDGRESCFVQRLEDILLCGEKHVLMLLLEDMLFAVEENVGWATTDTGGLLDETMGNLLVEQMVDDEPKIPWERNAVQEPVQFGLVALEMFLQRCIGRREHRERPLVFRHQYLLWPPRGPERYLIYIMWEQNSSRWRFFPFFLRPTRYGILGRALYVYNSHSLRPFWGTNNSDSLTGVFALSPLPYSTSLLLTPRPYSTSLLLPLLPLSTRSTSPPPQLDPSFILLPNWYHALQ